MSRITALIAVLACVIYGSQGSPTRADADPVRLAVYYETLCPDSQAFVRNQLSVAYPELNDIMDVDINAYGKATDVANSDGGYDFTCQHGPNECIGNILLACAKKYIEDQETYVNFNICVMTSADPPTSGVECSDTVGVTYDPIGACAAAVEGQQLLHDIGLLTAALDPVLDYVPWMVANDMHTDEIQQQAEFNLTSFVCDQYQGTLPTACAP